MTRVSCGVALALFVATAAVQGQGDGRRLATIDALREYPAFYHLQRVLLRGELVVTDTRVMLRADDQELRVLLDDGVGTPRGPLEVSGVLVDVGRLQPGDPRAGRSNVTADDAANWPRPGEELILRASATLEVPAVSAPTVRTLAIEPWRFDGEEVTVIGNFRGRNLYGDLAGAPGRSRYDFVIRGTQGAIWVTDLRPRGRGFELDVNRRVDTGAWVEVTGTVRRERGLVALAGTAVRVVDAPEDEEDGPVEHDLPAPPPSPLEVVFSSPTGGEIDVATAAPIRIQFSKGLTESSLEGQIRLRYVPPGDAGGQPEPDLAHTVTYNGASRSIEIVPDEPLVPGRTVELELRDGLLAFDGAPLTPWTLTFTVGP